MRNIFSDFARFRSNDRNGACVRIDASKIYTYSYLKSFAIKLMLVVGMVCGITIITFGQTIDELTNSLIGVSGTSYSSWSGKTSNSDAVYAGNSAGGNNAIQLRSSNSNSGIVTTTSGGSVTKIKVTWNNNTTSGRTLDIYGKTTAYSAPTDLYNSSTQGTKIGSIVYGTSTELTISGSYTYIGLRSNSGAMYLNRIEITWATVAPISYSITAESNNTTLGTVSLSGPTITAFPQECVGYANSAYTVTSGTATVSQSGNTFNVTPTSNCTVRINFEAIPTYTVSFSTGSSGIVAPSPITETACGAGVRLPSVAPCRAKYSFVGWRETPITSPTDNTGTCYPPNSIYYPASNCTLHAVYMYDDDNIYDLIDVDDIVSGGNCIIHAEDALEYSMSNTIDGSHHVSAVEMQSTNNGSWYIETTNTNVIWRIYGNSTDGYYLYNPSIDKYLNIKTISSRSELVFEDTPEKFSITHPSGSSSKVNIVARNIASYNYLSYHYSAGYFNAYSSSSTDIYIYYNSATYTSEPECNCTDATISTTNATYRIGSGTLDLNDYYASQNTATPTFTCSPSGATITDGHLFSTSTSGEYTISLHQDADGTYCTTDASFIVTANIYHNVEWMVNGTVVAMQEYIHGEDLVAPSYDFTGYDCNNKIFVGWTNSPIDGETNTPPATLNPSGTVNANMTYYAVFAEDGGGSGIIYSFAGGTKEQLGETGVTYSGLGSNYAENNAPYRLKFDDDGDYIIIPCSSNPMSLTFGVKMIGGASSSTFTIKAATDGSNYVDVQSFSTSGSQNTILSFTTTNPFPSSTSHIKIIFTKGSNVGMGPISISGQVQSYSAYSTSCVPCEADATISSTALIASGITISSATINCPGGITNFGGAHCLISSYGFVYGTSANPTLENGTEVVAGTTYTTTNTSFNKIIEGLDPCATYHVRAYATNGHGTAYGPDFTFTTANNATITSLRPDCLKNTEATINITYSSCTAASDIFVIAIRKGANGPVSLGTTSPVSITANTVMGSGYQFGESPNNSYVVYKSNGSTMPTSLTITGLEAGTSYKLKAYRWQSAEGRWTTDGASRTLTMPSVTNLQADNDETSEILTWNISGTVCAGGHYVVICKEGDSDITSTCENFTSITANAAFGSGTLTQTGEYAVYSGSATTASITNITSGTTYTAAVFYVDADGNCSRPAQTTFTYSTTTILEPGDLAIVAIDNSINYGSNSGDEFSFMIFKNITPETSIDMTDNGYERNYEGYWGTSEGAFRITRKNSTLSAGSVITITEKDGRINNPTLGDYGNIDIYVNGSKDNANWEISWQGVGYDHFSEYGGDTIPAFDLNSADQIWIMQGGEWNYILKNKAEYTGNVLYGYTATGWKSSFGYNDNKGSTIYPGCDCFVSTLDLETGISKYKGPFTEVTKREWIMRINDKSNWGRNSEYTESRPHDDNNYATKAPFYRDRSEGPQAGVSYPLPIAPGDFTKGKWNGRESDDWCDCRNWVSLVVPDENYDVEIPDVGNRNRVSLHEGVTAKCKTLTVKSGGFFNNTQANSVLKVVDDITIDVGGSFRPSENKAFEIIIGGNILNNGVFITNESTSLTLNGESSQSISAPSSGGNFKLRNLTIASPSNVFDADTIELYGNLRDNSASNLGFNLPQALTFKGTNSQTSTRTAITDITMNKSSNNLTLSGMLTVDGKAKFVKGNIIGNVTFLASATSSNANINSYVDGTVTKKANASAFTFPTGSNGVLGTLEVSSLDADTDLKFNHEPDGFDASEMPVWWNQNNMCGPNEGNAKFDHVTNMYFWNLGTSATIADAVFSVSADDDVHFNSETIEHDNADIDMAIYDGCWKNLGGTAATSDPYHLISVSDVDLPATRAGGDKVVTFGSIDHNTLLPIELTAFSAECNGSYAKILWTTATERNNDYFVLERSDDAISFDEIARLAGAGSSINPIDYTYIDNNVHGGDIFYRLVQVDYDGTRSVSEIIAVNCTIDADGEPEMAVYPNPFANDLALHFENFGDRTALVEVYDMLGRMLVSRKVVCSQNDYEFVLPLGGLPDGAYNVRVCAEDVVINRQVVKNR